MRRIYLDYAATMPLLPEAKAAMLQVMELDAGNASALHYAGQTAQHIIEKSRSSVARLLHTFPESIIFTSGGTESNNTVMEIFRDQKIFTSAIEHPSVLAAAKARARELTIIGVDQTGRVDLSKLEEQLVQKQPALVSIMFSSNELGTIEPIRAISKLCHQYHAAVHTDATQAFGKIPINVAELEIDYLTCSGHKIGGPMGIGVLYVRPDVKFRPLLYGGKQENGRRAGTSNTLAIAGMGAAADWCWQNWSCRQWAKVAELRDLLKHRILTEVPYSSINSPENDCLPNILNASFQAAEGESIQLYLDLEGIAVSTGSACASGDLAPSHVIMATRHDAEVAHNSIRFSLGLDTTAADIDRVMQILPDIVKKLQAISTIQIKEQHESE